MRTRAVAFAGSRTSPFTWTVTTAFQRSGSTETDSTAPTGTSPTRTIDCGTRSTTSGNSMRTG
ncbi:hypothetical protein PSA01_26650 [Pseudonocardia saturnea]|uniref:Uncharacterized protein n=1 Tax=Pseudonocardia saturnea TaxID=33909 RepID=A0ABQ0RYC2_9PSEU|nr:hypothetical protein Pdca_58710 [Pseudonocardia autotrophica]GEC25636.1 hypothetical protein PSA01_26650 [Pseudonocardia saturnea]